jgi:hypothetical protein
MERREEGMGGVWKQGGGEQGRVDRPLLVVCSESMWDDEGTVCARATTGLACQA